MNMRLCKSELDMFEECKYDPINYAKFVELATATQKLTPNYFYYDRGNEKPF